MSNQIYENERTKYYAQTCLTTFGISAPQSISVGGVGYIVFNTVTSPQGIAEIYFGNVKAIDKGMYMFNTTFDYANGTDPAGDDTEFIFNMKLISPTRSNSAILLTSTHQRSVATGSSSGSNNRIISSSAITYMEPGDYVYMEITNLVSETITIKIENTKCNVQKIY